MHSVIDSVMLHLHPPPSLIRPNCYSTSHDSTTIKFLLVLKCSMLTTGQRWSLMRTQFNSKEIWANCRGCLARACQRKSNGRVTRVTKSVCRRAPTIRPSGPVQEALEQFVVVRQLPESSLLVAFHRWDGRS